MMSYNSTLSLFEWMHRLFPNSILTHFRPDKLNYFNLFAIVLIILQHAPFDTSHLIKHLLSPDEVSCWWLRTDSRLAVKTHTPVLSSDSLLVFCSWMAGLWDTQEKYTEPTSVTAEEEGAHLSRPTLAALFATFSMKCTANITSNN